MSVIKTFSEFINESTWNSRPDISRGTFGAKKVITTNRDLRKKIEELYKEQGEGDTLDVSSLTNLINRCYDFSYIFKGYKKVKYIIGLEDWDVSHVEYMGGMFANSYNFNCDLSKWDVSNVKNMEGMFLNCENFNCDLSNWDVSNVKDMRYMFEGCKSLKQIPSWYKNKGLNESIWSDMRDRITGGFSYSKLKRRDCTLDVLYKYLINNYEVLGDEQIKLTSHESFGNTYYSLWVPITLSGEAIETEIEYTDYKNIVSSIRFTHPLIKYVKKMKTVTEYYLQDDVDDDDYSRACTKSYPVLCSEIADFIDEILTMVPDPALRKKIRK